MSADVDQNLSLKTNGKYKILWNSLKTHFKIEVSKQKSIVLIQNFHFKIKMKQTKNQKKKNMSIIVNVQDQTYIYRFHSFVVVCFIDSPL